MRQKGFTLIELMVAVSLSLLLSMSIMWIANQTRKIYNRSVSRVELYKKLRYAFSLMENELSNMVPTCDLEFFIDTNSNQTGRNGHWDPTEELRSPINLAGGYGGDNLYTEAPQIVERYFTRKHKKTNATRNPAFEIYFRAPVHFGASEKFANVEYRLVKAIDLVKLMSQKFRNKTKIPYTRKQLPTVTSVEENEELSLVRIVRYMDRNIDILKKPVWNDLMKSQITEIASNVDSFKIEYYACNPYGRVAVGGGMRGKPVAGWYTPAKDRGSTAVEYSSVQLTEKGGQPVYIKQFIYGTSRLTSAFPGSTISRRPPRGMIRRAIKMDPRSNAQTNTRPALFYVPLQFGELGIGDKVYIWPDLSSQQPFLGGEFTVKNMTYRGLVFKESIETSGWRRDKTGLRYKAAYLPMALRITMVLTLSNGKKKYSSELKRIINLKIKTDN